jgi:Zn-finger nucleic acid-binding protein
MKCPVCEAQLQVAPYEGVTVHVCPQCRGTLVEADRLRAIERRRERQWSEAELQAVATRVASSDGATRRRCPRCLMFMDRIDASWDACAFHLDRCEACKVVWLDEGELDLVQAKYEKEVDSRTPEDWARIERVAVADMQLKENLRAEAEAEVAAVQSAAGAVGEGPVGVAAFVARCALRDVQQGIDEDSAARRKSAFIRAGILLLAALAIAALWYYLTGGRWYGWR